MGCSNDHEKPNLNEKITKPTEENKINNDNKIKKEKQSVIKPRVIRVQSIRNNEDNNNNNNESNNNNNEEKNDVITIKNNNYLYFNNNNNNNENNKEDILTLYH